MLPNMVTPEALTWEQKNEKNKKKKKKKAEGEEEKCSKTITWQKCRSTQGQEVGSPAGSKDFTATLLMQ